MTTEILTSDTVCDEKVAKFGSTPKKKEEGELSLNTVTKGDIEGAKLLIDNMYTQFSIKGITYQAKSLSNSNCDFEGGATVDFDFEDEQKWELEWDDFMSHFSQGEITIGTEAKYNKASSIWMAKTQRVNDHMGKSVSVMMVSGAKKKLKSYKAVLLGYDSDSDEYEFKFKGDGKKWQCDRVEAINMLDNGGLKLLGEVKKQIVKIPNTTKNTTVKDITIPKKMASNLRTPKKKQEGHSSNSEEPGGPNRLGNLAARRKLSPWKRKEFVPRALESWLPPLPPIAHQSVTVKVVVVVVVVVAVVVVFSTVTAVAMKQNTKIITPVDNNPF